MTALISKYKLVDRDSNDIGPKWKILAIIGLSAAFIASVGTSFSFYSFNHGFDPIDDRCIIEASPKLKTVENNSTNITTIDLANSIWGFKKDCDYVIYSKLFQGMTAIIWISFFMVCGNGGVNKSPHSSGVPKPSLIVVPVTIYFIAMIILAAYEAPLIDNEIAKFCYQLKNETDQFNTSCRQLVQDFSDKTKETSYSIFSPEWNYLLTLTFSWLTLVAFCICFIVMILRCVFVADFELIKIEVTKDSSNPLLYKSLTESEESPSTSNNSSINERKLRDTRRRRLKVDEIDRSKRPPHTRVTFADDS